MLETIGPASSIGGPPPGDSLPQTIEFAIVTSLESNDIAEPVVPVVL